jgi:hypothetical protein
MRFSALLGVLCVDATLGSAQENTLLPQVEIGLNYSLLHANLHEDVNRVANNGGSGYFVYNINHVLGVVADFGSYHRRSRREPNYRRFLSRDARVLTILKLKCEAREYERTAKAMLDRSVATASTSYIVDIKALT